jgi:hypothetical protein
VEYILTTGSKMDKPMILVALSKTYNYTPVLKLLIMSFNMSVNNCSVIKYCQFSGYTAHPWQRDHVDVVEAAVSIVVDGYVVVRC